VRSRFISSEQNPEIKRIKALRDRRSVRHAERLCVVEGPRFVHDAAAIELPLQIIVSESHGTGDVPRSDEVLLVPDQLFERISDTTTPQGMLAIFRIPEIRASDSATPLLLIADGIQDPGNLGTMIRSAAALGATGVVCGPGTVDPYAPKVIRAAAAAHWNVPIMMTADIGKTLAGACLLVADGTAKTRIDQVDLTVPCTVAIGSEGIGVSDRILSLPHTPVAIPMSESVESLNSGIASSIILYEAQRQRRHDARR
jgi:TrmH family RNA methyltransferase